MPRTLFLISKKEEEPTEFTVRLTAQPRDDPVTSSWLFHKLVTGPVRQTLFGPLFFTISTAKSLTFTAGTNSNWNIYQTVTITPRDDNNFDDDPAVANYVVSFAVSMRLEAFYQSISFST